MNKLFTKLSTLLIILLITFMFMKLNSDAARVTDFDLNGAVSSGKKDGVDTLTKNDGTIIYKYKDKDKAVFKDGTIIEKYKNGNREVLYKDGSKVKVLPSKGLRIYISSSGNERSISFESKTPYGEDIYSFEKLVQKKPIIVKMVYNPKKSDEVFDGIILKFYNELYDAFVHKVLKRRYESKKPLTVSVSYCRFCEMGYCYGKEPQVEVEFLENGKSFKSFVFPAYLIDDIKKKKEFIKKVINSL